MFRLIAFDLDDTLLLPSGEISERTRSAVRALHERGVQIALASGRMLPTMMPVVDALGFAPALVSYNGAQVNLRSDTPPLYHRPVLADLAGHIIDLTRERGLHLNFYYQDHLYATGIDDWRARYYREQTGATLELEPNLERWRGLEPTKLVIIEEPHVVEGLLAEWGEAFRGRLTVTRSKPIYLEILHPAVQKGAGFTALCQALDIATEDTAAFGDSYNDIEMLEAAGTAVAVDNALPEVKAVVDRVCASNEHDGVAEVLEEWLQNMPAPTEPLSAAAPARR